MTIFYCNKYYFIVFFFLLSNYSIIVLIIFICIFLEPKCQYSGHELVTKYSKISISNNGRYLFTGCKKNGGFLWSTKSKKPQYVNKPMLKMAECFSTVDINSSDWCIDPKCLKVSNKLLSIKILIVW